MMKDLRLLYKPPEGLDNLLALRHAPELKVWDGGYDTTTGDWSEVKARQVASTIVPAPHPTDSYDAFTWSSTGPIAWEWMNLST